MRFLMCLRPYYGHLHPMAPTARALERDGHEVIFSTAESFRAAVEAEGFRFEPAGCDPRDPLREGEDPAGRGWAELVTRDKLDALLALTTTSPPDVVVRE